jgi:hypothetical protein
MGCLGRYPAEAKGHKSLVDIFRRQCHDDVNIVSRPDLPMRDNGHAANKDISDGRPLQSGSNFRNVLFPDYWQHGFTGEVFLLFTPAA